MKGPAFLCLGTILITFIGSTTQQISYEPHSQQVLRVATSTNQPQYNPYYEHQTDSGQTQIPQTQFSNQGTPGLDNRFNNQGTPGLDNQFSNQGTPGLDNRFGSRQPPQNRVINTNNRKVTFEGSSNAPSTFAAGDRVTTFAWDLFQKTRFGSGRQNQNIILSPILVQNILAMLEKAAGGNTKYQIQQAIKNISLEELKPVFNGPKSQHSTLEYANGIFIDNSQRLNENFVQTLNLKSNAEIRNIDFQNSERAKIEINGWAHDKTNGEIKKLLPNAYDTVGVQMLLTSAVYFSSTWKYKFEPSKIVEPFYSDQGQPMAAEFMESRQEMVFDKVRGSTGVIATLIEIPYEDNVHSMVLLVPEGANTLDTLINSVTSADISNQIKDLPGARTTILKLKMPKFRIETLVSLNNALLGLQLTDLFSINSNLSGLGLDQSLKISDVLQQAVMTVDEKGTTAASATATILIPLSADSIFETSYTINTPFIAMIINKEHHFPLFVSRIYKPY